ncbi:hypothetical protein J7T55_010600 [Diaporthe amygdali]|uniref:uncharacterized protein n=1 Tax=Phomopsis amygdali TaxID=1214568 RepID=UPI0022FEEF80|nr:uncharacterized protein J7T55_010600 [Diaporthe amygdali]KAJ0115777.1 hypothetical protein J7T55_010600 [Diaporthe amygdali]
MVNFCQATDARELHQRRPSVAMAVTTRQDHGLATPSPFLGLSPGSPALQLGDLIGTVNGELYAGWYLASPHQPLSDPAKSAYESALDILEKTLTIDEYQTPWLQRQSSMQDVREAVVQALKEYRTKAKGNKVQEWLSSCSERVMYYGAIFDTFAQHHPEYVSLAWGAMKFLFISVLNHEELLSEISKAIANLADVLPRTELHSILYPTARMQEAVSLLYAKIIEFVVKAIKWCKKGKARHAIAAIAHPFELKFKAIIDEITKRSRAVDELANAASKAEIRDLHFTVHQMSTSIAQLTETMAFHQQQQTIHNQSLLSLRAEQQHMFRMAQIEEFRRTVLLLDDTPDASQNFAFCKSMRTRRRQRLPTQLPMTALSKLRAWVSDPSSSMILAQGQGIKTSSLDFAVDFSDAVLDRDYPVIWALPGDIDSSQPTPSVIGILRSLISQLLELEYGQPQNGASSVALKHFKGKTNTRHWFEILERCISNFSRLFVIIDTSLVQNSLQEEVRGDEDFALSDFTQSFSDIVTRSDKEGLKVVVISWRFDTATSMESGGIFDEMQFATDMGSRVQRMMRQPRYRAMFRRRDQSLAKNLNFPVNGIP